MRLSHWLGLVALVTGIGCLQVSQRTAIMLGGYAVGQRMSRVHAQETSVSWLSASVAGLASPTHLAQVAQEKHLKLVARSTAPRSLSPKAAGLQQAAPAGPPIQLAADETLD